MDLCSVIMMISVKQD